MGQLWLLTVHGQSALLCYVKLNRHKYMADESSVNCNRVLKDANKGKGAGGDV